LRSINQILPIDTEQLHPESPVQHETRTVEMKKWSDSALHRTGCPYKGVAVFGTKEEVAKYYSGNCPGCNVPVKWEEERSDRTHRMERNPH
jgi:hypothetical protein